MSSAGSVRIELSGTARVYCVHDREKRQVKTERDVFELGLAAGLIYNPKLHQTHRCACCENLFVDPTDEPRFCSLCQGQNRHELGGSLPEPIGVVDG